MSWAQWFSKSKKKEVEPKPVEGDDPNDEDTMSDHEPTPSTSRPVPRNRSASLSQAVEEYRLSTVTRASGSKKLPNVLRASIVAPERRVMPPLPRLSLEESTSDKLKEVMEKFDKLANDDFDDN